jgi:hypothetical protein
LVPKEMEGNWSSEQIASGLQLAQSGVPLVEVTRIMGVSEEVFSTWKAEYAQLFDQLIIRLPGPKQPNDRTNATVGRRIAYLSGSVGGEEVESELRECKLRYSVIDDPAALAGDMLRSGSVLGNFQEPVTWNCLPSDSLPTLKRSSDHAVSTASGGMPHPSRGRLLEKQEAPGDCPQMRHAQRSLLILVSAQIVNPRRDSPQSGVSGGAAFQSGVCSAEIDELRWQMGLAGGGQVDVPITESVGLKFSLDGILDAPIDAIRLFYTSPMDALLLGNLLIRKSDSPTRRA